MSPPWPRHITLAIRYGVILLSACDEERKAPDPQVFLCDALVSTVMITPAPMMPTVLDARWTTLTAGRSRVVYENGAGRRREGVWVEGAGDHAQVLLGLLPEREITWTIEVEGETCVTQGTVLTGSFGTVLPRASVTGSARDHWTVLPVSTTDNSWVWILDEDANPVWVWEHPRPTSGERPPTPFRARLSRDGTSILYNYQAGGLTMPSQIGRVSLTGEELGDRTVVGGHTDFVELPGDRIATLGWVTRYYSDEDRTLLGDTVVVMELDGSSREIWNVFDHFEPDLTVQWSSGFVVEDPTIEDWSHINGISYDEATGDLLVTSTFSNGAIRIASDTGEMLWALGTPGDITAPTGEIDWPHSVQDLGGDQVLMFNRRNPVEGGVCSFVAEMALDRSAGTATTTWSYEAPDCVYTAFLGEARRLSNGNTWINWCSGGRIDEVDPDGAVVWQLALSAGAGFTYGEAIPPLN